MWPSTDMTLSEKKGRKAESHREQNRSLIISLCAGTACTPNTQPPTQQTHTQTHTLKGLFLTPSITAPLLHAGLIFDVCFAWVPAVSCNRRFSFSPMRNNKTKQSNGSVALPVGTWRACLFVGLANRKVAVSFFALMKMIIPAHGSSPVSTSLLMPAWSGEYIRVKYPFSNPLTCSTLLWPVCGF